jgi:hypothetical protein
LHLLWSGNQSALGRADRMEAGDGKLKISIYHDPGETSPGKPGGENGFR